MRFMSPAGLAKLRRALRLEPFEGGDQFLCRAAAIRRILAQTHRDDPIECRIERAIKWPIECRGAGVAGLRERRGIDFENARDRGRSRLRNEWIRSAGDFVDEHAE